MVGSSSNKILRLHFTYSTEYRPGSGYYSYKPEATTERKVKEAFFYQCESTQLTTRYALTRALVKED
jgi:hypothetical protein